MKKKIIVTLILLVVPTLIILNKNEKEEIKELSNINNMISYTIDGKSTSEKITKTSGYKAKKITCDYNSNLVWDNTNWEVEIIKLENQDNCIIDFTKNEEPTDKIININTSTPEGIDSISKTTIENGKIIFYPKEGYILTGVSGCSGNIEKEKLIINNVTGKETCTVTLVKPTLKDKILADKTTRPGKRTDFSNVLTTANTKTLYTEDGNYTEGGKTVYYFAGNATDNWVYFADLYWRIIRINEDNSVRLLYVGPDSATTSAFIQNRTAYNGTYNNTAYVGYMYGGTGSLSANRNNTTNSPIKTVIDNWYANNLNASYNGYVSQTAIYCNDRSGDGYKSSGQMYYAVYNRLNSNKRPSYKCGNNPSGSLYGDNNVADKFTKSTSTGNGKLTYPIALMTADEVAFAGGKYATNAPTWYYYNSTVGSATGSDKWWTMSPNYFGASGYADVFLVFGANAPGFLAAAGSSESSVGVRPVLSLKSCVTYENGDGSSSNPYTVTIDNTCSAAEN